MKKTKREEKNAGKSRLYENKAGPFGPSVGLVE